MIHLPIQESTADRMAGSTIRISGWMISSVLFTGGEDSIMTRLAVIDDAIMIKCCGYETRGPMANTAIIVGRHMAVGFSYGANTMTCRTVIDNVLVIILSSRKGCGVMAHRTIF